MKPIAHLIAVLLLTVMLQAQTGSSNQQPAVASQKDPAKKAAALEALCEELRFSNPDSLFTIANEFLALARQQNNTNWQGTASFYLAIYYNVKGNADTALLIAEENIALVKKSGNQIVLLAKLYAMAGNSLMRLNRQKDALQMFYNSLEQAELAKDNDALFKAYNNIGWAHMELEQFEKAITNFSKCIAVMAQLHTADRYATPYNNIASCYGAVGEMDSAYKYAQKGIAVAIKAQDYSAEANGYSIMGTFLAKEKNYEKALANFQKALALREKSGDPYFLVSDLAEMSSLYAKLDRTKEGIAAGQEALNIAEANNISAKFLMIYSSLAENYDAAHDYEQSSLLYRKMNGLKDSLYADANPKALAEMQTKYESAKKEQQIIEQKNRLRLQNYLFIGIGGLVLLIGLLIHSRYKREKLKKEQQLQAAIMRQQELAVKAVMEAEENERERIAKDLHDGVGQMMSAAKMNLSAFESELQPGNNEQHLAFQKIIGLVDESCKEVRTVSHIMMPNALLKNDLGAAIRDFVDKLTNKNLKVHVYTEGLDERMDSNAETVLYRVIQECVNNVLKHADASALDISLIRDKDGISGTIEDNGKGFDTNDKEKFDGIGLKNIITRIEYLKGTVDFDSSPGRGTVVALHVPNQ